jgi:hypothetical protein
VAGALGTLIGILHTAFTPNVHAGYSTVAPERALGVAYFFGAMGQYVIFTGLLTVYSAFGLRRGEAWAWRVGLGTAAVNTINGIGAVVVGFCHAPALAWLGASASLCVVLLVLRDGFDTSAPCFTYGPTTWPRLRWSLTWPGPSWASSSTTEDDSCPASIATS